jgi:3-dehydroquinate dehydratase
MCRGEATRLGLDLKFHQSNHEGQSSAFGVLGYTIALNGLYQLAQQS